MTEMVRICKAPSIQEMTDRWGQSTGVFEVVDIQGDIPCGMWEDVKQFEHYYDTEEGKAEQANATRLTGLGMERISEHLPLMNRLLKRSHGLIWQFNLRYHVLSQDTSEYVRTFAVFGEPTLREWTPEHDATVKRLTEECRRLNQKGAT